MFQFRFCFVAHVRAAQKLLAARKNTQLATLPANPYYAAAPLAVIPARKDEDGYIACHSFELAAECAAAS